MFASGGSALYDMSKRTGVAVETLSALGVTAVQSGIDLDTVEKALRKISLEAVKAAGGGQEVVESLAAIGLTAADLKNLAPDKMLELVGRRILDLPNPATKAAVAMRLLGEEAGTKLIPFLEAVATGAPEAAAAMGLVVSTDEARAAKELSQAWLTLSAGLGRLVAIAGGALAPALQSVAEWLTRVIVPVTAWLSENKELVIIVAAVAAGTVAAGAALTAIGLVLQGLVPILGAATAALGLWFAPWAVIARTIGSVVYVTGAYKPILDALTPAMNKTIDLFLDLGETGMNAWTGIKDAIAAGDLELAGKVAMAGLKLAWKQTTNFLSNAWREFTKVFVEAFHSAVDGVADLLASIPGVDWVFGVEKGDLKKELARQAVADQNRRERERQAARSAEDAAVAQAAQALADAMQEAKEARQASERRRTPQALAKAVPDLEAIHQRLSTAGTFNAFGARGLGGGDHQSRIAAASEETARNTKETVRQFKELAKGLTFA